MRRRINRAAVCSSENYSASRKAHKSMLEEKHSSFCPTAISSETAESPFKKNISVSLVVISVFGKPIKITKEEYDTIAKPLGF